MDNGRHTDGLCGYRIRLYLFKNKTYRYIRYLQWCIFMYHILSTERRSPTYTIMVLHGIKMHTSP